MKHHVPLLRARGIISEQLRAIYFLLSLEGLFKTDSVQSLSNTCKNYLLKIYSQHSNFLNAI